ncbi:MAG: alpha/beta hydrolase [Leptospiraceae bacterium]|nr:alpha/beta hydrolase [Leptospiraceae bacterium]
MKEIIEKFSVNGTTLEIKIQDVNKEDSLLLIHGFNDTKETFVFLEKELLKYFNLISYDHRGHGNSAWNEDGIYHYSELLLDLHKVVEKYLPERFSVLGHSLGAGLAARYFGIFPEKCKWLILLEGFAGVKPMSKEREKLKEWVLSFTTKTHPKEETSILKEMVSSENGHKAKKKSMTFHDAVQKLSMLYKHLPLDKVEILTSFLTKQVGTNTYEWKNDPNLKKFSPIPFPPELSRELRRNISSPVLLFFGEKTHLRPNNLEEICSHFQNLVFYEVPNASHNMHHDHPEFVLEKIQAHLGLTK